MSGFMSKYYEWQKHEFYAEGELQYRYYAIAMPFPKGKISQFEFDLNGNNFEFGIMTYNDKNDDENLKIEKASPKIEKRIKYIIHVDKITKYKIFDFILKYANRS